MILAGPSYALALTATYPVIGAVLADRMLRQRLTGVGWLAVVGTTLGAALTAFDASSSDTSVRTLVGLAVAGCIVVVAGAGLTILSGRQQPSPQASAPATVAPGPAPVLRRRWGRLRRTPWFGRAVAGGSSAEWRGSRGDRASGPPGAAAAARRGARRARPAP